MSYQEDLPETSGYSKVSVVISAIVGLALAVVSVWWAAGTAVFYEGLFRVSPTVAGGGIGTDWVVGNTVPWLDFLVALVHAADVLMGVFILLMVFIHWAAFRRLAGQMQRPGEGTTEAVATDGGETE
ncbi:hypothetical protein [Haloplanus natans]|uniref:hypothetical protein n=1 Tax=Haloplanus natans TaxID=376171 RepID=UPI000677630F|nr:hypothetical protein [Haloplanus natans]